MGDDVVQDVTDTDPDQRVEVRRGGIRAAVVADGDLGIELECAGVLMPRVRLGLLVGAHDLADSRILGARRGREHGAWIASSGKSTGRLEYDHEVLEVELLHKSGLSWQLQLRASGDGIAFRYAATGLEGTARVQADKTTLSLPRTGRAWVLDYQPWYETTRRGVPVADLPAGGYGFPFLLGIADGGATFVLVTEAAVDGRFCGAYAQVDADGGLRFQLADDAVEVARGPLTPWRVLLLGDLARIVESRLVDELSPDPVPEGPPAVRPGRAAWSWWSDFYSGAQLAHQKHLVDRAAEFGWEHLLIDCGWEETWVPEIVSYASRRGIQVHLWVVWHDLDGPHKLSRLAVWRSWGVAGIKVDFMESESKDRYRWYDTVLAETARLGLMVNFHGSVIPRGWVRTWPQVVGFEAVRGAEYYVFYQDSPLRAEHNVILPFTRNVVGAMDYTPVALTAPGRTTSDGHELGLAVAFECGITHFADDVDVYASRPEVARALSELPARWDETRLLAGTPDTEAILARRSADRWFIGGVATGAARTLDVPLDRLGGQRWRYWAATDAEDGGLRETSGLAQRGIEVPIAQDGGFFLVLAPEGSELLRARPRGTQPPPVLEPERATLDAAHQARLTTSPTARLRTPPGWSASTSGRGDWLVAAPADIAPGSVGVITAEEPGDDGVPVIAHARVAAPLTPGEHVLSALPMLAFGNESGPVERDLSNGGGNPRDGGPMRVAGGAFDDGLGVSTPSFLQVALDGRASRLRLAVGVDDETPGTRARAAVVADGVTRASVEVVGGQPAIPLELDLRGARTLELRTEPIAPSDAPAHVDWADGRIVVLPEELSETPIPDQR